MFTNIKYSGMPESNQQPIELQSIALPIELIPDPQIKHLKYL